MNVTENVEVTLPNGVRVAGATAYDQFSEEGLLLLNIIREQDAKIARLASNQRTLSENQQTLNGSMQRVASMRRASQHDALITIDREDGSQVVLRRVG